MRHFFLTGTSGIGKSTLLMEVLQEMAFPISGFFAQRQLLPDGTTGGFRLLPWSSKHPLTATYQAEASDLFIKKNGHRLAKRFTCFSDNCNYTVK